MGDVLKRNYEQRDLVDSYFRMRNLLKMALDYIESLSFIEFDNGNYECLHEGLISELYGCNIGNFPFEKCQEQGYFPSEKCK